MTFERKSLNLKIVIYYISKKGEIIMPTGKVEYKLLKKYLWIL